MSELPTPRSVRSPQGGAADRGERDGRGVADVERVDVRTQWDADGARRSFHRPPIEAGPLGAEVRVASIVLILSGLVCGVGAFGRWMRNERAMRLGLPLPSSPMLLILTVIVALVALVSLLVVSLA